MSGFGQNSRMLFCRSSLSEARVEGRSPRQSFPLRHLAVPLRHHSLSSVRSLCDELLIRSKFGYSCSMSHGQLQIFIRIGCYIYLFAIGTIFKEKVPWQALVGLGYAHYILSIIFARPIEKAKSATRIQWLKFAGLVGLAILFWQKMGEFLFLMFFVHHALTETYQGLGWIRKSHSQVSGEYTWFALRFAFELMATFAITHGDPYSPYGKMLPSQWSYWLSLLFFGLYVLVFLWKRLDVPDDYRTEAFGLPIVTLVAVLFSYHSGYFEGGISWLFILSYHGLIWTFLPLVRKTSTGLYARKTYFTVSLAVIFLACGLVAPVNIFGSYIGQLVYSSFLFLGFFHITSSLALSPSNPRFVVNFFGLSNSYR